MKHFKPYFKRIRKCVNLTEIGREKKVKNKMRRIIVIMYAFMFALTYCRSDPDALEDVGEPEEFAEYLEDNIATIENAAAFAERVTREGILPLEETEKYHEQIADTIQDIIEMLKDSSQAYAFIKAKGVDRVIMPNISVKYPKLRVSLLMLLKNLFKLLPTTAEAVVPIFTLDKLVDIFDLDDNLGIKAHALDILAMWLVENPKAQVRVIKMRGVEPFYRQIPKLSTSVTASLLELFNKLLEEHIRVRNDKSARNKADSDKLLLYQRMGLIERISTKGYCEGILNIFYSTWTHTNQEVPIPVLKLVKNTLPYCGKVLTGQKKAIKLFKALRDHIENVDINMYSGHSDFNLTDLKAVLDFYAGKMDSGIKKDEF